LRYDETHESDGQENQGADAGGNANSRNYLLGRVRYTDEVESSVGVLVTGLTYLDRLRRPDRGRIHEGKQGLKGGVNHEWDGLSL